MRGKNWKSKNNGDAEMGNQSQDDANSSENESGILKVHTQFIEIKTDLSQLLKNEVGMKESGFGIVGLHTCGDLASNSIKIFLANEKV